METRIALITCSGEEKTQEIAEKLVRSGLVACVNIIPYVQSIYQWEGKIERDAETLMIVKTTREALAQLEQFVHQLHPYNTPEFVVLTPEHVAPKYQKWLTDVVRLDGEQTTSDR